MAKKRQQKEKNKPSSLEIRHGSKMSRYISFIMLVITVVVCGFFFFNVIKGFLLPLFLATLLAVIFRPVHSWVSQKCGTRPALAASISTSLIMLVVLVPMAGIMSLGLYEANEVVRSRKTYIAKLTEVRASLGLQKPFAEQLDAIESELGKLDAAFQASSNSDDDYIDSLLSDSRSSIKKELKDLKIQARDATVDLKSDSDLAPMMSGASALFEQSKRLSVTDPDEAADEASRFKQDLAALEESPEGKLAYGVYELSAALANQLGDVPANAIKDTDLPTAEKRSLRYVLSRMSRSEEQPIPGFIELVDGFAAKLSAIPPVADEEEDAQTPSNMARQTAYSDTLFEYQAMKTALLGGPFLEKGIELVNPSEAEIEGFVSKLLSGTATRWLPSITNTATSLITGLLMGICIMAIALFYFFMDGPKMVQTFMHLSPLDDRHEMLLLEEFDKVARAVVLATLLSAVGQGILGGIGYKIAGLDSVFLLMLLTTVLSLIPFVGAAAIWFPCCIYIAFLQESTTPDAGRTWMYIRAGFLAVYGVGVISMADNVIKPWVLQGQSKLHPLLALLSVLGGVQALGPIGILVGPMVVAFLQVLLTILQREITALDEEIKTSGET